MIYDIYLFLLSGVGITNLIVNSTLLEPFRNFLTKRSLFLSSLLTCMMCSGFWVGFFLSYQFYIDPLLGGAVISISSNMFGYLIEYIEIKTGVLALELHHDEDEDEDTIA